MESTTQETNKRLTREAFESLFNQRDLTALEKYWSPNYIQHSAHIPPGREGLGQLVQSLPAGLKYESSIMMAEGDFVMVNGRYSGLPGPNWVVVDILRVENGLFVEHWDIIQDEATKESSLSGSPMYGDSFGIIPLS